MTWGKKEMKAALETNKVNTSVRMPLMVLEEAKIFAKRSRTRISDYIRTAVAEKNAAMRSSK